MNKRELVELTARDAGVSMQTARSVMNCCFRVISDSLCAGEELYLPFCGKFTYKLVPEQYAYFKNPPILVPEHYRLVFKTSNPIKQSVKRLPTDRLIVKAEDEEFEVEE